MTYYTQNFRHASGAYASGVTIRVLDLGNVEVTTGVTDQYGNITVDLPAGDYQWEYGGHEVPFTILPNVEELRGAANGVAPLDATAKVPTANLPGSGGFDDAAATLEFEGALQ